MAEQTIDLDSIKRKMLRKYPAFGATISGVKYQIVGNNHPVKTAATDGKTIYANAQYMASLPEDEQVFTLAHEVCHIALKHIQRSKDKDMRLWNIATDAVINQHLKKDGLPLSKGVVDIADALEYDAEELYAKLLEEKQQQEKQKEQQQGQQGQGQSQQNGQGQQSQGQQGQGQNSNEQQGTQGSSKDNSQDESEQPQGSGQGQESDDSQVGHDDHSMWQEAAKREEQEQEQAKAKGKGKNSENESQENEESQFVSEKKAFEVNEEQKIKRAEEVMRKINGERRGVGGETQEVYFEDIGRAEKGVANWKRLLVKTLEIEDEAWGHKFSDRASGYAARIEDVEYDEKAETEIILDTSGSVSVDLLKNFLRQVKTVLKNSTIKVGTFSDSFHGFVEIKRESDIDSLRIRVGGGTNFDAASKAFTKRKDVNKICFTDGCDGGDAGIREKRKDIVWISFENPEFKPDDGKVIFVPKKQINLQRKVEEPEMTL